MEARQ
jgi:hypothetical protein